MRPAQEGKKRRVRREDAKRKAVAALYANTPEFPPSRQVKRKAARAKAKTMRDKKHGWRDFIETVRK